MVFLKCGNIHLFSLLTNKYDNIIFYFVRNHVSIWWLFVKYYNALSMTNGVLSNAPIDNSTIVVLVIVYNV